MTDHVDLLLTARELDSRVSDGIHVRLRWNEPDDRVLVSVSDHRTGDAFALPVRRGQRALDVLASPVRVRRLRRMSGDVLGRSLIDVAGKGGAGGEHRRRGARRDC